jgi:hypothetical protein
MKVKATNIVYDTDGLKIRLPKTLTFKVDDPDFQPEYDLADLISDKTGWCVIAFNYEIL